MKFLDNKTFDRRQGNRQPCRVPVRVFATEDLDSESFVLESSDLSEYGVFVRTDLLFPVGEQMVLELAIPGSARPVRGQGVVTRVVENPQGAGMGLKLKPAV